MNTKPDFGCRPGSLCADLIDRDLLSIQSGERFWKLYCFRSGQEATGYLEHRIYTKLKTDGRLALVTFAMRVSEDGQVARSKIARVVDLPAEALDRLIAAIQTEAQVTPEAQVSVDLSNFEDLDEQMARLRDG